MSTATKSRSMPIIAIDMPVMFEDEGYEEMGESLPHSTSEAIIRFGLMAHLRRQPELEVLSDMNLHYHPLKRKAYVSPDVMVVQPKHPHRPDRTSYRVGKDGAMPTLIVEILSKRTHQQGDLTLKPEIYAENGVAEYILVDVTGQFLPKLLELRKLQTNGKWSVKRDSDGGVTSNLGFRIRRMADGQVRLFDVHTGNSYPRPDEAADEAEARQDAEQRANIAEAEVARLRELLKKATGQDS